MKATKAELKRAFMAGSKHEFDFVNDKHGDGPSIGFEKWYLKRKYAATIIGLSVASFIMGQLHERFKYYRKTGKHLQDVKQTQPKQNGN